VFHVVEHKCVCGANVDVFGNHGLSCRCSGGRILWHAAVNETVRRALVSGGVPAVLESVGVSRDDGKRSDGMSLIPWRQGLPLLWDFTCSDTLAPSTSSRGASRLVNSAESAKTKKYSPPSTFPLSVLRPLVLGDLVHICWYGG